MDPTPPASRRVFILGRRAELDVASVAETVRVASRELVLLSVGHPPASGQDAIVGQALDLADRLRLWLDASLVTSPKELAGLVRVDYDVSILATGRERRRIERALGARSHAGRSDPAAAILRPATVPHLRTAPVVMGADG